MTTVDPGVLDNPAWASLTGAHAGFAQILGRAARYPADVAPFHALADPADPDAWADLAALAGPGTEVSVAGGPLTSPPGWELTGAGAGVQLVDDGVDTLPEPGARVLGSGDVPQIMSLIERTQPGPFRERTVELGTYLGIFEHGALVAMAGERLHPPGWTEISAVCTDPAHRRRGLATRLVRAVAHGIRARGETPFMHANAKNVTAIRLYESLGFRLRRQTTFGRYRALGVH